MRIDSWNEDPADPDNQPILQPDEAGSRGSVDYRSHGGGNQLHVTWNQQASAWTVDIKSARKLEELHQTLWMFTDQPAGGDPGPLLQPLGRPQTALIRLTSYANLEA